MIWQPPTSPRCDIYHTTLITSVKIYGKHSAKMGFARIAEMQYINECSTSNKYVYCSISFVFTCCVALVYQLMQAMHRVVLLNLGWRFAKHNINRYRVHIHLGILQILLLIVVDFESCRNQISLLRISISSETNVLLFWEYLDLSVIHTCNAIIISNMALLRAWWITKLPVFSIFYSLDTKARFPKANCKTHDKHYVGRLGE